MMANSAGDDKHYRSFFSKTGTLNSIFKQAGLKKE